MCNVEKGLSLSFGSELCENLERAILFKRTWKNKSIELIIKKWKSFKLQISTSLNSHWKLIFRITWTFEICWFDVSSKKFNVMDKFSSGFWKMLIMLKQDFCLSNF